MFLTIWTKKYVGILLQKISFMNRFINYQTPNCVESENATKIACFINLPLSKRIVLIALIACFITSLFMNQACFEIRNDGNCDEECNNEFGYWDGGDCDTCPERWVGDGYCDSWCNTEEYDYDGGDC